MYEDLIEQLRNIDGAFMDFDVNKFPYSCAIDICEKAADAIEVLQEELKEVRSILNTANKTLEYLGY